MRPAWHELTSAQKAARVRAYIFRWDSPIPPSARDIAKAVGAPSRDAVIGVCHRQSIELNGQPGRPPATNGRQA